MSESDENQTSSPACPMPDRSRDDRVRELLGKPLAVAVVGMSPSPDRPSRMIGLYLRDHGFQVYPIHPSAGEIEGLPAYRTLDDLPEGAALDVVDVCVAAEHADAIAEAAARAGARILWFQPGAENPEQEDRARGLGLEVFSGRCMMADHQRLIGS